MDYYSKLIITITFFFFINFFVSASPKCFQAQCGQNEPIIESPFWINGIQPESCGYLSYNLSCNRANRTILNLPHSGEFNVESIYYGLQKIALSDANNCLARKLLTLNLSTTPFNSGNYYENFTFFNCSKIEVDSVYKRYVISCLSGSNYSVTATSSAYVSRQFLTTCMVIKKVKFPTYFTYFTSDIFGGKLLLNWDIPYCWGCEGRCDYKNTYTLETTCIDVPKKGSNKAVVVVTIIGVTIVIVLGVCGIPCYLSCASQEIRTDEVVVGNLASSTVVITATSGLDMDTLNSYTKVIIGESYRLPNPEDDTCPICMSKYEPYDTIKSIPECSHYFHVDCIDEWLRQNATCPFCRTTPLPKTF